MTNYITNFILSLKPNILGPKPVFGRNYESLKFLFILSSLDLFETVKQRLENIKKMWKCAQRQHSIFSSSCSGFVPRNKFSIRHVSNHVDQHR